MTETNRLEEVLVNGDKQQPEDPLVKGREQIEAFNNYRIQAAKMDLDTLMKKYNVTLQTRQLLINGMPAGQTEIVIVPN
jgi:hypothetical protein